MEIGKAGVETIEAEIGIERIQINSPRFGEIPQEGRKLEIGKAGVETIEAEIGIERIQINSPRKNKTGSRKN